MTIRKVMESDYTEIKKLLVESYSNPTISDLSAYPSVQALNQYWLHPATISYVALVDDEIIGSFTIRENHPELGGHIANVSYIILVEHLFKGYEFMMCVFALNIARDLGFISIQFDLIINPERHELPKWEELGFSVIGELENETHQPRDKHLRTFVLAKRL